MTQGRARAICLPAAYFGWITGGGPSTAGSRIRTAARPVPNVVTAATPGAPLVDEPAKVVSERLGHSTVTLTLDTYAHVLPTMQQRAAERTGTILGYRPAVAQAGG